MANLLTSFNAGVSGLKSAQASLNTTSHNLANAQTKGYTRQQTIITDSFYQKTWGSHDNLLLVGTGTTIVKTRQIRNVFLDARYRLQVGRQGFYEANQKATYEIEDMLGELQGQEFSASINELHEALNAIAKDPDDIVTKEQMVSVAAQFIERAQVLQGELNTYQTSLNQEVRKQVNQINDLVTKIREMNKQIQKFEATGESANDYRDKRNDYLDDLAQIINFEVNEEKDGTITIYSEGSYLLDTANQYYLTTEYESPTSRLLKPVWESGGDYFLYDNLSFSSSNETDVGSLRGMLVARGNYAAKYTDMPVKPKEEDYQNAGGGLDKKAYISAMNQYADDIEEYNNSVGASVVMKVQAQLDTLIHGIVTMVNDAFCPNKELTLADGSTITVLDEEKAYIGDDEYDTMGTEVFTRRNCERYTKTKVKVISEDGTEDSIDVYQYNEEDPEDVYSLYTIGQLEVNPVLLKDSSTLPVKYNKTSDKANAYARDDLLVIANSFHNKIGSLNPGSLSTYNVFDFYDNMVTELSTQGSVWNGIVENQQLTVATADDERQNVMGVSSDEELSELIKFQRCYDASSRYITTVSEMLEYLIERLGG